MDNRGQNRSNASQKKVNSSGRPVNKTVSPQNRTAGNGPRRQGQAAKKKLFDKKITITPRMTLYIAIGAVLLTLVILAMVNIIIGVRSIEVSGTRLSNAEEIISVSEIKEGSGYFSYNTSKAEKKVLEAVPCVSEIEISRSMFGKVRITVTEKKALWYVEFFGNYLALSDTLEVVRIEDTKRSYIDKGLVRIDFPEVHSAILRKPIEFSDGDRDCSFIWDFLSKIQESDFYKEGRMDQICIESKFEIFVVCDLKYKIKIGKYANVDFKLKEVKKALNHGDFGEDEKWELDASGAPDIVSRPEPKLDFEYLIP